MEDKVALPSGWAVSAMYTLGDTIITATPIPFKALPKINQNVDENVPTKIHPKIMIGEEIRNVVLIPKT